MVKTDLTIAKERRIKECRFLFLLWKEGKKIPFAINCLMTNSTPGFLGIHVHTHHY